MADRYRRVTVLIPAHNEEAGISKTIASLRQQTRLPDRIIVVCDNCTDATPAIAKFYGCEVFITKDNTAKKAGALNQALKKVLKKKHKGETVLVMDADSILCDTWIASALSYIDSGYVACGGVFTGQSGGKWLGTFQRNEYARYQRDVARMGGKTLVLTGTATLFRASVLRKIVKARAYGFLPGEPKVYDEKVLTEDNELTFALLHLGHSIIAPAECHLTTEIMTTWGDLYRQRLRWKRGALENLFDYGLTRYTIKYWLRQLLSLLGVLVTFLYIFSIVQSLVTTGTIHLHPIWMIVTLIFILEQVITVRSRGWFQMLLAATLVVEMGFNIFLQIAQAQAFFDAAVGKERKW